MISRHAIAVSLSIEIDDVVIYYVFAARKGDGVAGIVNPGESKSPALVQLIDADDFNVMPPILSRPKPLPNSIAD